jgi:hypothetical protein
MNLWRKREREKGKPHGEINEDCAVEEELEIHG